MTDEKVTYEVEFETQRQMLERLGIEWVPGEPFVAVVEDEINRLRIELHRMAESRRGQRERADELSAECDQWQKKVAELWAERERINSEWREQIQVEHATYQELQAEVERLKASERADIDAALRHNRDLSRGQAEIERLRAALREIAAYAQVETVNPFYFVQLARKALGA
jgi:hypothetical protein